MKLIAKAVKPRCDRNSVIGRTEAAGQKHARETPVLDEISSGDNVNTAENKKTQHSHSLSISIS